MKHSTINSFCVQEDLVKVRFHHSEKYQHIPVRIPKTEKNKDGTKPCKMCSEGKTRLQEVLYDDVMLDIYRCN